MFYTTTIYLHCPKPKEAIAFLIGALGFEKITSEPNPLLSNGSLSIRIIRGDVPAMLELQCSDIEADAGQLLQHVSVEKRTDIVTFHDHLEQHLYADMGIMLILIKPLSEDDKGELIPLPTTLPWQDGLIEKAQYILKSTPLAFREKARLNVVEKAEFSAIESGGLQVFEHHVMQAFSQVTPPFQHQTLYEAMKSQSVDANQYLDPSKWEEKH